MQQRLTDLAQNQLLPKELVALLERYIETAGENLSVLFEILNTSAQELPVKCTSLQELRSISTDWLWKRYMRVFVHLKPDAEEITKFIRTYLDADNATRS